MAPEQGVSTSPRRHTHRYIQRLGCTLHYLLIGRAAYDGENLVGQVGGRITRTPIPNTASTTGRVHGTSQRTIFRKMVAKKVEDRFQTMGEVISAVWKQFNLWVRWPRRLLSRLPRPGTRLPDQVEGNSLANTGNLAAMTKPLAAITQVVASEK